MDDPRNVLFAAVVVTIICVILHLIKLHYGYI